MRESATAAAKPLVSGSIAVDQDCQTTSVLVALEALPLAGLAKLAALEAPHLAALGAACVKLKTVSQTAVLALR